MNPRLARAAWWTLPSLLCLIIYWYGLKAWFLQDDFAWLGLRLMIHNQRDFWAALFTPMAQGSVRPLSERGFFLLFESLFGLNALPFRIWVFLTQFANLALIAWLAWKLTGSRSVGFWAPILWLVNPALATPMSWTSSYNQILCAFFLLASLSLFVRYAETGERRYYWLQWIPFLLGFGALELNVVYPAIAALYSIACARRRVFSTLPMFGVSLIYTLVHRHYAQVQTSGPYVMHWDSSIFSTLAAYLRLVTGLQRVDRLFLEPAGQASPPQS
jgi:Predicted membrane-bound mannosyltransferase